MTRYCVACKKRYVSGDPNIHFHSFPKKIEQRKKWMQILGMSSVPQNARVCGDHFESSSYHPHECYLVKHKILRSNAVPSLELKNFGDITNLNANDKYSSNHSGRTSDGAQVTVDGDKNLPRKEDNPSVALLGVEKDCNSNLRSSDENNLQRVEGLLHCQPQGNGLVTYIYTIRQPAFVNCNNKMDCPTDKEEDSTTNNNVLKEIKVDNNHQENVIDSSSNILERESSVNIHQIHPTKESAAISDENCEPEMINQNDSLQKGIESSTSDTENNGNLKRKRSAQDYSDASIKSNKRYRWKDGFAFKSLGREDFTSDRAWNLFLELMALQKNQLEVLRKRCERKDKKIASLNDQLRVLVGKKIKTQVNI